MLEESAKDIRIRMDRIEKSANYLCASLAGASVSMPDEESARYLFTKLRGYIRLVSSPDAFDANVYLKSVEELVELAESFKEVHPFGDIYEELRDTYEVFLFNKVSVIKTLNQLRRQEQTEALRDNYWMN